MKEQLELKESCKCEFCIMTKSYFFIFYSLLLFCLFFFSFLLPSFFFFFLQNLWSVLNEKEIMQCVSWFLSVNKYSLQRFLIIIKVYLILISGLSLTAFGSSAWKSLQTSCFDHSVPRYDNKVLSVFKSINTTLKFPTYISSFTCRLQLYGS